MHWFESTMRAGKLHQPLDMSHIMVMAGGATHVEHIGIGTNINLLMQQLYGLTNVSWANIIPFQAKAFNVKIHLIPTWMKTTTGPP